MSKIGVEPIRSIFGIAACVFQMAALGRFELHVSWMRIRYTRPTIRKSLVAGAGFEPAKPEGKRFWRGRWGTIPQPSDRQSEALTNWATPSQSLLVDQLEYPALIGTSVESRTPLHSMKSYCPTARRQRHQRIFCTSTYHLTASSWLLVDLAVILSCCIEIASDHTLLYRKKKSRYIWYVVLVNYTTVPNFWRDWWDSNPRLRLWMQVELLCVSFKWYLDRATIPEPTDYGVETKTWTWIFS